MSDQKSAPTHMLTSCGLFTEIDRKSRCTLPSARPPCIELIQAHNVDVINVRTG